MPKPIRTKKKVAKSRKKPISAAKNTVAKAKECPDQKLFRSSLWIALAVAVLDQVSKLIALFYLLPATPVQVLPALNLTLAFNSGAAFSFLSNAGGWQRWLFIALSVVISAFLIFWLRQLGRREAWTGRALGLILGGAVGNVWDRFFRSGQVVDFIDVYYGKAHWPAFNLADAAISIGAAIIVLQAITEATAAHHE